ncbi:DUF1104 domain-containing protein [Helicobacter sp. MIT 05-5294]|uniref:DUF1104 domain-containing protein n=1 Tax=Helicobacter sp. MIT 05-5294 TaxID=1548150 RepID=UPI000A43A241|nr:DUF1104 domain-containing protein [Helicobacter sp. MIT 05-5294]TLD86727.1 DUF1104 domain-containing protein [Helicobacter sp. MIT 05-5294]
MKTKFIFSVALVGALISSALSADYSKTSNEELVKLSGKVSPKDYPDYKIEIHKRIEEMKVKDARAFQEQLRAAHLKATEKMSETEYRKYQEERRIAIQKHMDSMTGAEIRESGLMGRGFHHNRGFHDTKGYGHGKRNLDCPTRPHRF